MLSEGARKCLNRKKEKLHKFNYNNFYIDRAKIAIIITPNIEREKKNHLKTSKKYLLLLAFN